MKKEETIGDEAEKSGSNKGVISLKIPYGYTEYRCALFQGNSYPIYKSEKLEVVICITEAFHIAIF